MHVSVILIRHGFAENIAIAGLLHDTVEDQDVPIAEIAALFGEDVARIVAAVTERKSANGAELPWEQRKAEKLAHLRTGGADVAAVKAADAIHNTSSILADYREIGPALWDRFKRGPDATLGYYRGIQDGVGGWLGDHAIVLELDETVAELTALLEKDA